MVLAISSDRRLTGVADFTSFLQAIEQAAAEDEDEHVEWKSSLDLSSPDGSFALARGVLGFANRDVQIAARKFDGCGYLVVGVEPGRHPGVAPMDPAQLTAKVDRYVGGVDGPAWDPRFFQYRGTTVLVVAVEPPRNGDPGWPLRRGSTSARDGTLYVRRRGSTDPANADEVRMLFRRAQSHAPLPFELACRLRPDRPLRRLDRGAFVQRWRRRAEREAEILRAEAAGPRERPEQHSEDSPTDPLADHLRDFEAR